MACALWGLRWQHRRVLVHCDNMAVVSILKSLTSKDHTIMQLLQCLHFFCAIFDISIRAQHVSGVNNTLADALSRDHLQVLFERAPWLNPVSTPVPNALLLLLVHTQPDWLSDTWRQLLLDSLNTVWPTILQVWPVPIFAALLNSKLAPTPSIRRLVDFVCGRSFPTGGTFHCAVLLVCSPPFAHCWGGW